MVKKAFESFCKFLRCAVCTISLYLFIPLSLYANPFFGEGQDNMVMLAAGRAAAATWLLPIGEGGMVPFGYLRASYYQPNTSFRLPGRQSVNVMQTFGWGESRHRSRDGYVWDWTGFETTFLYFQQDVALFYGRNWYTGMGMGMGMQARENERVGTKLVFSFKVFAGYAVTDSLRIEAFMHHFSNGSTQVENYSYNFMGVGFGYSF